MDWATTYLKYLVVFWISIFLFYAIGRIVVGLIEKLIDRNFRFQSTLKNLFIQLAAGMTFSVLIFSILFTGGRTVNLLIIYVVIVFLWTLKKTSATSVTGSINHSDRTILKEIVLYGCLIFSLFAFEIIRRDDWSSILRVQHLVDWGLYSVHTETIPQTAQENTYNVHNILDPDYHGTNPYHYFELWLGTILTKFLPHASRVYLFSMIIYPVLCVFALIASWMWLEEIGSSTRTFRFLAFMCLFATGWFFLSSQFIQGTGFLRLLVGSFDDLNAFLIDVPKRAIVFAFLLGALLLIKNNQIRPGFVMLLSLPVLSVDSIPAVFGGTLLFIIFVLRKKSVSIKDVLFVFITYAIFAVLFFSFYKLFGNHIISLYSLSDVIRQAFSFSDGKFILPFMFAARALLAALALYSFHLFMLSRVGAGLRSARLQPIIVLLFCMFLSALAGWSLLYAYIESIQFFSAFLTALQTFVLILCIPLIWLLPKSSMKMLLVTFLVVTAIFNFYATYLPVRASLPYSKQYLDEINKYNPISKVGVCIRGREDFSKRWVERHIITHTLGDDYLIFMSQYLKPVEIGTLDFPDIQFRERPKRIPVLNIPVDFDSVDAYRNRMMKQSSIFYRYYNEIKKEKPAIKVEEAQREFIELHKIDWAILSKNVPISNILEKKINRTIVDPISGEKFLILQK